jgi:hypothetical protein
MTTPTPTLARMRGREWEGAFPFQPRMLSHG